MLIYITNREVADMPVSRPKTISVKKIGQGLSKRKEKGKPVFLTGLASDDYSRVRFYPPGSEPDLFDQVEASEYKRKPWLVFLHGFHQDPWETVEKARLLETFDVVNSSRILSTSNALTGQGRSMHLMLTIFSMS